MIKFYIIGATGILVNLGILYVLTEYFNIRPIIGLCVGIVAATTTNFIGNKVWTFRNTENKRKRVVAQYGYYWLCSLPGIILQVTSFYGLTNFLPRIWYLHSGLIAIVIASFVNFILSKFWVFKQNDGIE
jgi:dolichol-phosphate mannosyltransferase